MSRRVPQLGDARLAIRGYSVRKVGVASFVFDLPGDFELSDATAEAHAANTDTAHRRKLQ